jgi:hypothetical protein
MHPDSLHPHSIVSLGQVFARLVYDGQWLDATDDSSGLAVGGSTVLFRVIALEVVDRVNVLEVLLVS